MITAIVLTYNEEIHIGRCLERLKPVADRIIVVDSYSTDATLEICRAAGVEVLQNPFVNQAVQFEWGVKAAGITDGWILRVDADEYIEADLADEIRARLPELPAEVSAISMQRKVLFQGQWIRWGGYYPVVLTRLWRAGAAHVEPRWMDEHVVVEKGETLLFRRGDLVDDNRKDITDWTAKHNNYSTRQMVEFIALEYPLFEGLNDSTTDGLNAHASRKRFLRNGLYARAPLYLRSLLYFLLRYFVRLGFLDGKKGFAFHTLQGFWNMLLIDVKIGEARRFIEERGIDAFRDHLRERHNLKLEIATSDD